MRTVGVICVGLWCVALGQGAATQERQETRDTNGSAALAAARAALGGAALDRIRTIRIDGRGSRDLGPMTLASRIEIRIGLPDRHVRLDHLAIGGVSSTIVTGVDVETLVQRASVAGGPVIDPVAQVPDDTRIASLATVTAMARRDFALWLLGFFAASVDAYPFEFADGGTAESPEGSADVVDVTGADGFTARLFIDSRTRLPLMVSWLGVDVQGLVRAVIPPTAGDGRPTPPTMDRLLALTQSSAEHRVYFGEHRTVGGVRWPFRVRRSVGGVLVEDMTFETIALDPAFAPDAFDPQP